MSQGLNNFREKRKRRRWREGGEGEKKVTQKVKLESNELDPKCNEFRCCFIKMND